MQILGIAAALADNVLNNSQLGELLGEQSASDFVSSRSLCLPNDYISSTKNSDPFESVKVAEQFPTDLSFAAAEAALSSAGVSSEELELLIAGTEAPLETTPSESQRLGKRLGNKTAAYDICFGAADAVFHINLLSKWKAERQPKYALSCSSNSPSFRLDFSAGDARWICGDAAVACVLSSSEEGLLKLKSSHCKSVALEEDGFESDTLFHLRLDAELFHSKMAEHDRALLKEIGSAKFFVPAFHLAPSEAGSSEVINSIEETGYHLGGSAAYGLMSAGKLASAGDEILVSCAGPGGTEGYALFERTEKAWRE